MCVCVCVHTCMCVCVHVHACVCACACMCVCCVHVCANSIAYLHKSQWENVLVAIATSNNRPIHLNSESNMP